MKKQSDNIKNTSIREQIWYQVNSALMNKCNIQPNEKVLFLKLSNAFKISDILRHQFSDISIESINLNSPILPMSDQNETDLAPNHYNVVFLFLPRHLLQLEDIPSLLTKIYNTLKPAGRFFFATSSSNTSSRITYQKVFESGLFPELESSSLMNDDVFLKKIMHYIEQSYFTAYHFDTYQLQIHLADLYQFKQYLEQAAYLYKEVISEKINKAIITKQVEFFDEICQNQHQGQYVFEYEVHTIFGSK